MLENGISKAYGLVFLLVDYLRVYLGVFDRTVPQQLGNRIDVGPERQHHRGEGVAARVESDRLCKKKHAGEV